MASRRLELSQAGNWTVQLMPRLDDKRRLLLDAPIADRAGTGNASMRYSPRFPDGGAAHKGAPQIRNFPHPATSTIPELQRTTQRAQSA